MKKNSAAVELFEEEDLSPSPPLKWAGGKRWLVPVLRRLYAPYRRRRLVEPFLGGMAVALGLRPKHALLNDINPHAVNFYMKLKTGLRVKVELENNAECYYRNRSRFNELVAKGKAHGVEAAGLFYYLNRTCYNGLCRFNSKGLFNVPFGKYRRIPYREAFTEYRKVLRGWGFRSMDFEELRLRKGDFIYSDPPFDVEFTKYSKEDFNWEDQVRLAKWLASHPGPVVASNQATARVIELYKSVGFRVQFVSAPRHISCTGDRAPAKEILALKNLE